MSTACWFMCWLMIAATASPGMSGLMLPEAISGSQTRVMSSCLSIFPIGFALSMRSICASAALCADSVLVFHATEVES